VSQPSGRHLVAIKMMRRPDTEASAHVFARDVGPIAHDLHADLQHLRSSSQLGEDRGALLHTNAGTPLARIAKGLVRTEELIDAFLTRARASLAELIPDSVDLPVHARAIVESLRLAEPHRDVVIDVASPTLAYGDSRFLVVVLDNLLGNAWKFTAKLTRAHFLPEAGGRGIKRSSHVV
jgi:signal transduction histidine kinase